MKPPTPLEIFDGDQELLNAFDAWFATTPMTKIPSVQAVNFMLPAIFAAGWKAGLEAAAVTAWTTGMSAKNGGTFPAAPRDVGATIAAEIRKLIKEATNETR